MTTVALIFVAWWAVLILVWALCRTAALNDREELPQWGTDASDREAGGPIQGSSVSSAPMVPYDRLRLVDDDFHPLLDLTKNGRDS